jgi:flagellar biosynthetic protein FliR
MIPQIPSYFVSAPFVMLGGLFILLQIDAGILSLFTSLVMQAIATLGQHG